MPSRLDLISSAALITAGLLCGLAISRPSSGQTPKAAPGLPPMPVAQSSEQMQVEAHKLAANMSAAVVGAGRYQVVSTGGLSYSIVIDTVTGRCWALYPTVINPDDSAHASDQQMFASDQDDSDTEDKDAGRNPLKRWVPLGTPPGLVGQ